MFLKIHHDDDASLIEVLDFKQLIDPFQTCLAGRLHGGEELQEPDLYEKARLSFPSGEPLPRCWCDPHYKK